MPIIEILNGESAEMKLSGRITFADGSDFRKKMNNLLGKSIKSLAVDLAQVTAMDSAGLGMLMVADKECKARSIALSLHKPTGEVKSLLELTKSYERFRITD